MAQTTQGILDSYKVLIPDFPATEGEILATREKLTTVNRELWISAIKRLRDEDVARREMRTAAGNEANEAQIMHYLRMCGLSITEWRMVFDLVVWTEEDRRNLCIMQKVVQYRNPNRRRRR